MLAYNIYSFTPLFYNYLLGHTHSEPGDEHCLLCSFLDLAVHYFPAVGDRAIYYRKLDELYHLCRKCFWGPHSDLEKRRPEVTVGPNDGIGGGVPIFVTWLLQTLSEQAHAIPRNGVDEVQLLKRMFWTTFVIHRTCRSRHRKFLCRRGRTFWELKERDGDSFIIDNGIKNWLKQLLAKISDDKIRERCTTKDCRTPGSCTTIVKIENAPELLLIRTPARVTTEVECDYFFKIPFTKTINLSPYSAKGESLVYKFTNMTSQLGKGYSRTGHVVSIVEAANGKHYKIDNSKVEYVVSPEWYINAMQQNDVQWDLRLLPNFFVYVRARDTATAPAAMDSDTSFSKIDDETAPQPRRCSRDRERGGATAPSRSMMRSRRRRGL